jgi:hypothetical protein
MNTLARVIVHWPGKDVPACIRHAEQLISIGRTLGVDVSVTPLFKAEECKNCENEKAKGDLTRVAG